VRQAHVPAPVLLQEALSLLSSSQVPSKARSDSRTVSPRRKQPVKVSLAAAVLQPCFRVRRLLHGELYTGSESLSKARSR
jgi:hypothetical protein